MCYGMLRYVMRVFTSFSHFGYITPCYVMQMLTSFSRFGSMLTPLPTMLLAGGAEDADAGAPPPPPTAAARPPTAAAAAPARPPPPPPPPLAARPAAGPPPAGAPSPLLRWQLLEVLYAYCLALRLYLGDWRDDGAGAAQALLDAAPGLAAGCV